MLLRLPLVLLRLRQRSLLRQLLQLLTELICVAFTSGRRDGGPRRIRCAEHVPAVDASHARNPL